jgi:hypothetical protein
VEGIYTGSRCARGSTAHVAQKEKIMQRPKKAEFLANIVLRKHPLVVQATDKGVRRLQLPWKKRRGELIGISRGFLLVRIDHQKRARTFHADFWKH